MWYTTDLARALEAARRAEMTPAPRRATKRTVVARRLRPAPAR